MEIIVSAEWSTGCLRSGRTVTGSTFSAFVSKQKKHYAEAKGAEGNGKSGSSRKVGAGSGPGGMTEALFLACENAFLTDVSIVPKSKDIALNGSGMSSDDESSKVDDGTEVYELFISES